MAHAGVMGAIELWQAQLTELQQRCRWVQVFETRGAMSGASNPHPHGQIRAPSFLLERASSAEVLRICSVPSPRRTPQLGCGLRHGPGSWTVEQPCSRLQGWR